MCHENFSSRSDRDSIATSMTAMTCKLNGLFSIGEDFDDEDLLGTDWPVRCASGPADVAAAVPSCSLRAPSAAHAEPHIVHRAGASHGTASRSSSHMVEQTFTLRQLSSSSSFSSLHPPTHNNNNTLNVASPQSHNPTPNPSVAPDDFDDWDIDLADLSECDGQMGQPLQPPAPRAPAPSAKTLRTPSCGGIQTLRQPRGTSPLLPRPTFQSAPPQSPGVFPGFTASSPAPSPMGRAVIRPQQPQRQWSTPGRPPQARGLFETVSPAPSPSSSNSHPHHTPVLTNRLVQLVSASNKRPKKMSSSESGRPRTRRFPGPAGLLPQQAVDESMNSVVVSVPHTPAHGAVARLPNQVSNSQTEEEEFSGGPWAWMKADMGLDERNPSCFLQSYSVVMVLRKAALKQLTKNKVPNMAVILKSIVHTHADAKAVFKDPTGEMQGTVHRRLLEDRVDELKVGAVLLLKQVGVFSPSHRNHYLNVTPNNLLRIYTSDGVSLTSTQLPSLVQEPPLQSTPTTCREPVSRMQLVFDDEDDEGQQSVRIPEGSANPEDGRVGPSRGPQQSAGKAAPQDWDADDDFDELLGELPEDTYSL